MPRICVCTAADAPTAHTSLLITVIAGATAVGGGDFTVVVLFDVESVVDLLVESVTIGSTAQAFIDVVITKSTAVAIFLYMLIPIFVIIIRV
jgi:hypothetical protein